MRSHLVIAASAALVLAASAEAQRPNRGQGRPDQTNQQADRGNRPDRPQRAAALSMDQLTTAWTAQAAGVAGTLELDQTQAKAVIDAYIKSRTSQRMTAAGAERPEAPQRNRQRGQQGAEGERPQRPDPAERQARREQMQQQARERAQRALEIAIEEREKLEADLAMVLEGQKLRYATEVLGSFDPRWDRMTSTLIGFQLDDEVNDVTMKLSENYIVETRTARDAAAVGAEGANDAMNAARERLLAGVKGLLTEEQYVAFERTLGGARGRGGQFQRGQGPGGASMADRMMEMDADGDGRLSKDEVPERMAERFFDFLDEDGDGYITKDEMEAAAERRRQRGGGRGGRGGGNRDN